MTFSQAPLGPGSVGSPSTKGGWGHCPQEDHKLGRDSYKGDCDGYASGQGSCLEFPTFLGSLESRGGDPGLAGALGAGTPQGPQAGENRTSSEGGKGGGRTQPASVTPRKTEPTQP